VIPPRLVQLVLSGAKRSAPDRLLKTHAKSLAGALVQRFREVLTANFKNSQGHPSESVHQRTSGRFLLKYQYLVWCTPFCTRLHQQHHLAGPAAAPA